VVGAPATTTAPTTSSSSRLPPPSSAEVGMSGSGAAPSSAPVSTEVGGWGTGGAVAPATPVVGGVISTVGSGTGSNATQPIPASFTSAQAVASWAVTSDDPADGEPAKPTTTRVGRPADRASRA
jgi:hypothetical protein